MGIPDEQAQPNPYKFLWARYQDIYAIAASLVRLGQITKYIAMVLSGVATVTAIVFALKLHSGGYFGEEVDWKVWLGVAFFGILASAAIFGLGVLIAACGQLLRALVDNSVNTSPLLTTEEKAVIILRAG